MFTTPIYELVSLNDSNLSQFHRLSRQPSVDSESICIDMHTQTSGSRCICKQIGSDTLGGFLPHSARRNLTHEGQLSLLRASFYTHNYLAGLELLDLCHLPSQEAYYVTYPHL
eukprot:669520-Hanusia_phi.AAC.1